MPERYMDFDLAAEIVAGVEVRVGKVGAQSVVTSKHGERHGSIALSRGGIVVPTHSYQQSYEARRREHVVLGGDREGTLIYPDAPEPTQPVYRPDLAVIDHGVGAEGNQGLHSSEGVTLSNDDSHEYVFSRGEDGFWRAFDTVGNSSDNYWTKTTEYFLEASRPVETNEEGLAIRGLLNTFDAALALRAEAAVREETGLLSQGY